MTDLFVAFYTRNNTGHSDPHLFVNDEYPTEYKCDGTQGSYTFNGYYYVENHPPPYPEDEKLKLYERPYRHSNYLPQILELYVKSYTTGEEHFYKVEIYKKEIHMNTDKISTITDDDGTEMNVCFFPTNLQTLYFKILETLK
jgi:hypothetical protein